MREHPVILDFHDETTTNSQANEEVDEFQELSPKAEKLLWHYRLECTRHSQQSTG
jgi:hypothetical protein